MLYVEEFYKKRFDGKTNVEAYKKATKWIANRVVKLSDETENIVWKTILLKGSPSCEVHLYCRVDEEKVYEQNCASCKEAHELFYMKSNKDCCATCRINPYRERMKQKADIMCRHFQRVIESEEEKEW